ncbi:phage tail protein [Escherichia coli]|uniref:phage tail protein n=1 Tax=Escherichia coli TaxID=562 RepID=UPI000BB7B45B|nr:phage tail protein [Escherichia coli]
MATNNFKPFATAANANVTAQDDWEALPALLSGFTAGKASSAQVNKAIRQATTIGALIGQFIANSGADALDNADVNGLVTKFTNALIANLRLGAGAPAIGIPFFWPLEAMPNTVMDEWSDMAFLKPNGASFSAATYPKLAKVWPGLVIPDMRGEFPRIWDDGRGVDSGRALLSYQGDASRNITGSFGGTTNNDTCSVLGQGAGVFANGTSLVTPTNGSVIGSATRPVTMTLDISRQVPTASEFRPRNFALNFLIRAK